MNRYTLLLTLLLPTGQLEQREAELSARCATDAILQAYIVRWPGELRSIDGWRLSGPALVPPRSPAALVALAA
jgi:hypothetical protein